MDFPTWTGTVERVSARFVEMLPAILGAISLLVVGWLLALLFRLVAKKLVVAVLARVEKHHGPSRGFGGANLADNAPRVIGAFVYWAILLFFAAAAMEKLPLPIVTGLLQSLAYYLPKVLMAVVLAFIGLAAGGLANQWVTGAASAAGVEYAPALGRVAQVGIFIVALTVGAQQIGLESGFFTSTLSIVIAATLGGMALAFGLGSGPVVSNIMSSYYAAKAYKIGDVIRVAGIEGTVREITPTTIVLDGADGEVHLPARKYCDEISVVVRGER